MDAILTWNSGESFSGETGGLFEEPPALASEAVENVAQMEHGSLISQCDQEKQGNIFKFIFRSPF